MTRRIADSTGAASAARARPGAASCFTMLGTSGTEPTSKRGFYRVGMSWVVMIRGRATLTVLMRRVLGRKLSKVSTSSL